MATKQLPLTGDETSGADALIPERPTLDKLRSTVDECRACPLWESATQPVFGEGLKRSRVMLIGEQPGDREDREGKPFVGPAGGILDKALDEAGIERGDAYVTNVVKHFKWEARGKRRIHQAPKAEEIKACAPWMEAEMEVVDPEVLVCLGATAVRAIIGSKHRVMRATGSSSSRSSGGRRWRHSTRRQSCERTTRTGPMRWRCSSATCAGSASDSRHSGLRPRGGYLTR